MKSSMLLLNFAFAFLCSFIAAVIAARDSSYRPCPLLGPRFPIPKAWSSSRTVQGALANLTRSFDDLVQNGDTGGYTTTTPNTTSFSLGLFSAHDLGNDFRPFFYEYHHTAPGLRNAESGAQEVDADSVYNTGALTQILTVYAFLVAAGEEHWLDKITEHVPELDHTTGIWSDIRLIDLATFLSGIPREATLDSLTGLDVPQALLSLLPTPLNFTAGDNAFATREAFFKTLNARRPIYKPATTPIYSDTGFQILAFAIESITKKTFEQVLTDAILNPLNMSSSTLGTPQTDTNAVMPGNTAASGWSTSITNSSSLLAANSVFSTVNDLSSLGRSILRSTLLSELQTRRWFKPHSQTSNAADDVGAPWVIYRATLTGDSTGALIPAYTKLGANGLYSPYFGILPDYEAGFVILSADTSRAADLNAYADLVSQHLVPALEIAAGEQAAYAFAGKYTSDDGITTLVIDVDGLSGLSLTRWTSGNDSDIRAAYAQLRGFPPDTLDFRLYQTNVVSTLNPDGGNRNVSFRAVLWDTAAPVDAGTPTCISWFDGVDQPVWNGQALDEFVFEVGGQGAIEVQVPALDMVLKRVSK